MAPPQKVNATPVKKARSSLFKQMQAQGSHNVDIASTTTMRRAQQQTSASTSSASASALVAADRPQALTVPADLSPASGWQSRVPSEYIMIHRADAKVQYRLTEKHFDDLLVDERPMGRQRITYLYKERDVERKAWELRGGPEGLEKFLRHRWKLYIEKGGSPDKFHEPRYYRVSTDPRGVPPDGSVDRLSSAAGPERDSFARRWCVLRAIEKRMDAWLWKACNVALVTACGGHPITATEHAEIMRRALVYTRTYPTRPAQPLPSSPAMDFLRAVLASAARYRKDDTDAQRVGLQYVGGDDPVNRAWSYDWDEEYRFDLFEALREVIDHHGMGELGWESARWEVYDTCADTLQRGLHYDPRPSERKWNDHSFRWLDKNYLEEGLEWYCNQEYPSGSDSMAH